MGPGRDVFSRFGHAALCLRDDDSPEGRCYNYGTTDFSTPGPLTWNVLRGRARFWVSVTSRDAMLAWYVAEDRTIWRQRVPLSVDAFTALKRRLHDDLRPGAREYVYHHFHDNCTTRIRDHLDAVTLGALRGSADTVHGVSWRAMVREGLHDDPSLLLASTLLLGRPLDARPSRWEAMFLPAVMRAEIEHRLGAPPEVLHRRSTPPPTPHPSSDTTLLGALAMLFGLIGATRRRAVRTFTGIFMGAIALAVWTLALASTLPELHDNDLRVVLLPTDLALGALRPPLLTLYARARIAMAATASCLQALGVSPQPLHALALLVVAVMLPWALPESPTAVPERYVPGS